jgi:hypothetical protein
LEKRKIKVMLVCFVERKQERMEESGSGGWLGMEGREISG